jgi:hypothetical protein
MAPLALQSQTPSWNVDVSVRPASSIDRSADQKNPFQYYELVGVQWPVDPSTLPDGPVDPSTLPDGMPNIKTMINPVIETFLQTENTGCLGCHITARTKDGSYGASFSFLFGHAK